MEIPPDSSLAQSSAYFTGFSRDEIIKRSLSQRPFEGPNFLTASSNRAQASTFTGELKDFKYEDFKEAHRMFNGIQQYPFQNIAQISNHKFDPFYFDGSENIENFNVNENLIGTPLGTSTFEDPRLSYVRNLLTLKEYEGQSNQLNDSYIKELYMVNAEKGSTYYENMLQRQKIALDNWSRNGRAIKSLNLDPVNFTVNLPQGSARHLQSRKRQITQTVFSETPFVQRNFRRERMARSAPSDPSDMVNSRSQGRYERNTDSEASITSSATSIQSNSRASSLRGSIISESDGSFSVTGSEQIYLNQTTPVAGTSFQDERDVYSIISDSMSRANSSASGSLNEAPFNAQNTNLQDSELTRTFQFESPSGRPSGVTTDLTSKRKKSKVRFEGNPLATDRAFNHAANKMSTSSILSSNSQSSNSSLGFSTIQKTGSTNNRTLQSKSFTDSSYIVSPLRPQSFDNLFTPGGRIDRGRPSASTADSSDRDDLRDLLNSSTQVRDTSNRSVTRCDDKITI